MDKLKYTDLDWMQRQKWILCLRLTCISKEMKKINIFYAVIEQLTKCIPILQPWNRQINILKAFIKSNNVKINKPGIKNELVRSFPVLYKYKVFYK